MEKENGPPETRGEGVRGGGECEELWAGGLATGFLELESWGGGLEICVGSFQPQRVLQPEHWGCFHCPAVLRLVNLPHSLQRAQGDNIPFI